MCLKFKSSNKLFLETKSMEKYLAMFSKGILISKILSLISKAKSSNSKVEIFIWKPYQLNNCFPKLYQYQDYFHNLMELILLIHIPWFKLFSFKFQIPSLLVCSYLSLGLLKLGNWFYCRWSFFLYVSSMA